MSSMNSSKVTITIPFDGKAESFLDWSTRIKASFKARDWWRHLDATAGSQDEEKKQNERTNPESERERAAVYASLVTSLPDSLVAAFACGGDENPAALWKSIVRHFQSTSVANRTHLRDKLSSAK